MLGTRALPVEAYQSLAEGNSNITFTFADSAGNESAQSPVLTVTIAKQPLGSTMRGTYNTFINQACSLFVVNQSSSMQNAQVMMVRLDGTIVVAGESITVPANGGLIYDACSRDILDTYGVISLIPNNSNTLAASVIRRGNSDDSRFPTLIRQ